MGWIPGKISEIFEISEIWLPAPGKISEIFEISEIWLLAR